MKIKTIIVGVSIIVLIVLAIAIQNQDCVSYFSPDKNSEIIFCNEDIPVIQNIWSNATCTFLELNENTTIEVCN